MVDGGGYPPARLERSPAQATVFANDDAGGFTEARAC